MANSTKLVEAIAKIFIIAYQENTKILEEFLSKEGFNYQVLRQKHQPEYKNYSSSYLALLNHKNAWEITARETQPNLIIEADFVPVIGFKQLPLPFNCKDKNIGIAWLYTCAPQLYSVSPEGYAQGFSTSCVAYIITPKAAQELIQLAEAIRQNPGPTSYSTWDSEIDNFLRKRNLKNYLPFRNYGEHGGIPNLEHSRYGLSKTHRADLLYGKLSFMPSYVNSYSVKRWGLFWERLQGRLKGIARLLMGKYLKIKTVRNSSVPMRLVRFAILRQLSL